MDLQHRQQIYEDGREPKQPMVLLAVKHVLSLFSRKKKIFDEEKASKCDPVPSVKASAPGTGPQNAHNGQQQESGIAAQAPQADAPDRQQVLADKLLEAARPSLFWSIKHKDDREKPKKHVLSIAAMQAVVLRDHQRKITAAGNNMLEGKMDEQLPDLLHQYCNAVRDMGYISGMENYGYDDHPFLLQSSNKLERNMLSACGLIPVSHQLPPATDDNEPRLGHQVIPRIHNRYMRMLLALLGGTALLVPIITMKLYPYDTPSLVTTSICVVLFSGALALKSNLRSREIFVLTAAYAGVLVIFLSLADYEF